MEFLLQEEAGEQSSGSLWKVGLGFLVIVILAIAVFRMRG